MSDKGRLYVFAVVTAGLSVALYSLYSLYTAPVGYEWFVLAGLTLLSGSFTVRVPTIPARLSVSETFVFTAVLLFGPSAATMVVALDSLVISLWINRNPRRGVRILFNLAAPALAVWIAGQVFYALSGVQPLARAHAAIFSLLPPLVVLAVLYFLLNSWLIAIAVALDQRTSAFTVWRHNFLWLSLNYFSGASVAALLLPYLTIPDHFAFIRVIGILLPLLLISYLTFKTALGRVEDANRHLTELNRLYISTIETLAMAIDAKDQITHGHIRRVQIFAVGLAKAMGVTDASQIKAVEAAALLHDMGKLAVPEYILNKPGPLTTAEFEKMKLHASVGADILSAIEFPYPVVPIVRHHHENWDGSGYPDGIRATDIPIGARILSVVDCFDALTSDRPYRPRLADAEALRILAQRRGTMYDPLIVDTFSRVYRDIAPSEIDVRPMVPCGVPNLAHSRHAASRLEDISASTEEMLSLYELARRLTERLTLADAADVIVQHLRRLIPVTTCVFYLYDEVADDLLVAHAAGENSPHFKGLRIPMGQRLSGWVAAHRQTILNSDPILDLGDVVRTLRPVLRSCLSAPLITGSNCIGVLTVYSTERNAFNEEHRRIVEVIGRQVSGTIRQAADIAAQKESSSRDKSTGLNRHQIPTFVSSELSHSPCSIVVLEFRNERKGVENPEDLAPEVLAAVEVVRAVLRSGDSIFRYDPHRLLVLLPQADSVAADLVVRSIHAALENRPRRDDLKPPFLSSIARATAPEDGAILAVLLAIAETRLSRRGADGQRAIH